MFRYLKKENRFIPPENVPLTCWRREDSLECEFGWLNKKGRTTRMIIECVKNNM